MAAAFSNFLDSAPTLSPLRTAIARHARAAEPDCVRALLPAARLAPEAASATRRLATGLIEALRAKGTSGLANGLVREYDLSTEEGVALMCLAEALLRIPDAPTRDALIRDKIGRGDWRGHLGHSDSLFVNAATWGLVVTGKLTGAPDQPGLSAALTRLLARGGEPLIRRGVDLAVRLLGEQFVSGETIGQALRNARALEARGFRFSYDMLGEAAVTADDAARYFADYEAAIHAIGAAAAGQGPYAGPGISVKLSALHPRYVRSQRARVLAELVPRLGALARLARHYDIGLNIDAEESDRLDLSLDLLEALCHDEALAGWNGIGFVVQAYGKRAPFVLDWVIDLARRTGQRVMLRLVKGAYWDSEIKRAQVDRLDDYPVFTRKRHTDLSYLACARKLLDAPDAVFPQFATHNAHSVAAIHTLAGPEFETGRYEFQCLHGMGVPLYEEVVGHNKLNRPCRIYAPVGTHETLLAYLVRRLLENGANSSFVNRIADPAVPVAELAADPVEAVDADELVGSPHPAVVLPRDLYRPARANAPGLDLADELRLAELAEALPRAALPQPGSGIPVRNPADHADIVGHATATTAEQVEAALTAATAAAPAWAATPPAERAACLRRAADGLAAQMTPLVALIVREAGKTVANAVADVAEAIDFLRYYAAEAERTLVPGAHAPLGVVACISPWNFPLAIFTGQVAAALAAGNAVLAKPAEQTPLTAAAAAAVLCEAGIPPGALHLLPGEGEVGAAIVGDCRVNGVVFTGSTAVAKAIARALAARLNPDGTPVPLIAETAGQNAMVVDSSALTEQVVADVLLSAFDSAGQRCSALRVLCLQEDVADRTLAMLRGAMAELVVGDPSRLRTDIGPLIDAEARDRVEAYLSAARAAGQPVDQRALPPECGAGTFAAPAIIELPSLAALGEEVFGPVLHVVRFRAGALDKLLADLAATGYGLTFGLHTRLDDTIARVTARAPAGNIYVNRTVVGAVVGTQPFGGHGLSGTGPKAGGPLYLRRLLARAPALADPPLLTRELPGPVGERNTYRTEPRGTVLCLATDERARAVQRDAAGATGNRASLDAAGPADVVLFSGSSSDLLDLQARIAARPGPIVPIHCPRADGTYPFEWLTEERVISTNTAAAGGNASLMTLTP